jgi:hypothetical protein
MEYRVQVMCRDEQKEIVVEAEHPLAAIIDVLVQLQFDSLERVGGISVSSV